MNFVRQVALAAVITSLGCAGEIATPAGNTDSDGAWVGSEESSQLGAAGAGASEVGVNAQALAQGFIKKTWSKGDPAVLLGATSEFHCYLTRVSGELSTGAEYLNVYKSGGNWMLAGSSRASNSLTGEATCVLRSALGKTSDAVPFSVAATASVNTKKGDWATVITGILGKFAGGGESVVVSQSPSVLSPSQLVAKKGHSYPVYGYAHAINASQTASSTESGGTASLATPILFKGPNGTGTADDAGEYYASSRYGGTTTITMDRSSLAVCFFTGLSGEFLGAGERARIYEASDSAGTVRWFLEAKSDSGRVYAHARCIARAVSATLLPFN